MRPVGDPRYPHRQADAPARSEPQPPTPAGRQRTRVTDSRTRTRSPRPARSPVLAERVGPSLEDTVTDNHAHKKAIRARMAATGEPYSVAARALHGDQAVAPAATL